MIRFLWNGLKGSDGKLQRAHYSFQRAWTTGTGKVIPTHITIFARDYDGFSSEIAAEFTIENRTDIQADYFDKDTIMVEPSHPRFRDVAAALLQGATKDATRCANHGKPQDAKNYANRAGEVRAFLAELDARSEAEASA